MPIETQSKYELAKEACKYSREQILEGSTLLKNNAYDVNKQLALQKAIIDMRHAVSNDMDFFLQIDHSIRYFEMSVAHSKKFSIGNCLEFALMALHYMLKEQPEMNAEVYHIEGGDHAFLVIGRKHGSDPYQPETWGDAYICDPWGDSVYPANEYLTKTKNFFQVKTNDGGYTNHIEDFNPSKHKLSPAQNLDTNYILGTVAISNSILLDVFSTLNERYLSIYSDFTADLNKIAEKVKNKYGENDLKYKILRERITAIENLAEELRNDFRRNTETIEISNNSNIYLPHKSVNDNLQQMLKKQMEELRRHKIDISKELNKYRKEESLTTMIMKIFNIKPASYREFTSVSLKSEEQLDEVKRLVNKSFKK